MKSRKSFLPFHRCSTLVASLFSLATLGLASAAGAAAPTPPPGDITYEVVEEGKGWSNIVAWSTSGVPSKGESPEPVADMWVVTPEGIESLPVDQAEKDELYEDFGLVPPKGDEQGEIFVAKNGQAEATTSSCDQGGGGGGGGGRFIIIDRNFHHNIVDQPEQYQTLARQRAESMSTDPEGLTCFGWDNDSRTKTWNINHTTSAASFELGNNVTGNFSLNFPFQSTGTATLDYRVKYFGCVPYKFQMRSVNATGTLNVAGDAQLQAAASLAANFEKEWAIAEPNLGTLTFHVGIIPVKVDFSLPITAGVKVNAEVSATLAQDFDFGLNGSFDYTCTTETCCGTNTFEDHYDSGDITASLQAKIKAEANTKVQLRAKVFSSSLLDAKAGLKGFVTGEVWGYLGNNCGDGNGDGNNETVRALVAEADAGIDLIYSLDGALVPDFSGSVSGPRFDLGWWDLLGAGNSTALSPMVLGPATANVGENVSYVVKMRPCYPYDKPVTLQVGPGSWDGNLQIAPGSNVPTQSSTTLSRSFPAAGAQTVTVTAVRDSAGRNLNTATSRALQINQTIVTPTSGSWVNQTYPGRAFDLYRNDSGRYVFMYYTYENNHPVWYLSDVELLVNNTFNGKMWRYVYDSETGGFREITDAGDVTLRFTSPTSATFQVSIGGVAGVVQNFAYHHGSQGRTGMYAPDELGGGLMLNESGGTVLATLAYYDITGQPIWVQGVTSSTPTLSLWMYRHTADGSSEDAGFMKVSTSPYGFLVVDSSVVQFERSGMPFRLIAY